MKQIIKYKAFDGTIFENKNECEAHEKMCIQEKINNVKK